jgi:hypothetical protein
MGYYLAIKNEDIMSFAGKWMELENILSEVTQIQKDMYSHVLTNNWILAKKKTEQNTQNTTHRTQEG